jgi:SAM-dependent methyltransferase
MVGGRAYDLMYRFGAPWEGGPRGELVRLVDSGMLTPETLPPGRAIDLGCGGGANAIFLAERGFEVTGVDFSRVALEKGRRAAVGRSFPRGLRFVLGDLTGDPGAERLGAFDLLVDYGTLDDLRPPKRRAMAENVKRLARPGAAFLLWCFSARRAELPVFSLSMLSRYAGVLEPGEEDELFADAFDIKRLPEPSPGSRSACFLMRRRADR